MLSLEQLKPNDHAVISQVCDGMNSTELMEMGLINGTVVRMVKSAPFGDPIQIQLRGYHLSLRKSEARSILVEILPNG